MVVDSRKIILTLNEVKPVENVNKSFQEFIRDISRLERSHFSFFLNLI